MLACLVSIAAAAYLAAGVVLLALPRAGYSHVRHTISELGEIGAPRQQLVALGLFVPVGVLTSVVAWLVFPHAPAVAALAGCLAAGYLLAAAFPCDQGSPLRGGRRQALHNLGGAIEYIGGSFALLAIAESFGQPFKVAGVAVLAATIAISLLPSGTVRGIAQRVAEACLFASLALASALRRRSAPSSSRCRRRSARAAPRRGEPARYSWAKIVTIAESSRL